MADGAFTVTVASASGGFYIEKSDLTIDYNPVPQTGYHTALGVGLVGLAGVGRKKFFKKG